MDQQQFSELLKKLKIPTNNRSYADIFDLLDAKLSEYLDRQDAASQELIDDIQDALDYAEIKKNEVGSGIALKREDESEPDGGADLDELRQAAEKARKEQEQIEGSSSALDDAINAALAAATQQNQQLNKVAWRRSGKLWFSSITGAENINTMFFQALDDLKYGEFDHANSIFEAILQVEPNNASAYLGKVLVTYKLKEIREIGSCYDKDIFNDTNMRRAYDHGDNQQKQYLDDARKEAESGRKYKDADKKAQNTDDESAQEEAAKLFAALGNYRDAQKRKTQCEEKAREIKYQKAVLVNKRAFTSADYYKAAKLYRELSGYKNADNLAAECETIAKRKEGEEAEEKRVAGIKTQFKGLVSQLESVANPILAQYRQAIQSGRTITTPIQMEEMRKRAYAVKEYAEKNDEVNSLRDIEEILATVENTVEEIGQLAKEYEDLFKEKKTERRSDLLVGLAVLAVLCFVGFPAPGGMTASFLTRVPARTTEDVLYVKNALSTEVTSFSSFHEMVLDRSGFIKTIVTPIAKIEQMTLKDGNYALLEIPKSVKKLYFDNAAGGEIPETVEEIYITGKCQNIKIPGTVKRVEIVNATLDYLEFPDGVEEILMDTVNAGNEVGIPSTVHKADINNVRFSVYYE